MTPTVPKRPTRPATMTAAEFRAQRPDRKGGKPWIRRSAPADRTVDGIKFDSKAEMARYLELRAQRDNGVRFLRQVAFDLAGVKFTVDFLVWTETQGRNRDGLSGLVATLWAEDTKGKGSHPEVLRRFRRNQKQLYALYGLRCVLVER